MKVCPACGAEYSDESKFCPADGQTLRSDAPAADLVGEVIADRYYVERKLGEGGMGRVYLAEHVRMGRKSAIKVMSPSLVHDPEAIARFNREASNASRITHPNVCAIYDFGETAEGLIYLAMEYVDGEPLTALLGREGTLPLGRAVELGRQVADALQAAHDLGIVHRDLKPDNVMLTRARDGKDVVKVVDFGIAKAVGGDIAGQTVTRTGFVIGTPEFMSPEQLAGDPLNVRSDIYSLGLVCYRMITGTLPFDADSAQDAMVKRLTENPKPLRVARRDVSFPPVLQAVFDRVLARRPEDRYPSAAHFARELLDAVGGGITAQMPATRADHAARTELIAPTVKPAGRTAPIARAPLPRPQRKRRVPLVAGVIGLVAVGGAATWVVVFAGDGGAPSVPIDSATVAQNPPRSAVDTTNSASTNQPEEEARQRPAGDDEGRRDLQELETRAPPTGSRTAAGSAPNVAQINNRIIAIGSADVASPDDLTQLMTYALDQSLPDSVKANAAAVLADAYMARKDFRGALVWLDSAVKWDPNKLRYQETRQGVLRLVGHQ